MRVQLLGVFSAALPALFLAGEAVYHLLHGRGGHPGRVIDRLGLATFAWGLSALFWTGLPWFRYGATWRWAVAGALLVAGAANLALASRAVRLDFRASGSAVGWLLLSLGAALALVWVWSWAAPSPTGLSVPLPLAGDRWYVTHGGPTWLTNHHARSREQRYAVDLVRVGLDGRSFRGTGSDNESHRSWDEPVFAPVDALVVVAVDGLPDRQPGELVGEDPAGNHVVIEVSPGVRLVFAHLKRGTVTVGPGQRVTAGTLLGRVGNSGYSSEPHLHLHAVREIAGTWVGIPLLFDGRTPVRGRVFHGRWAGVEQ